MLSKRNLQILRILYGADRPLTSRKIAEELNVSLRTVQYALRDLEDWARKNQVLLDIRQKVGIRLLDKNTVREILEKQGETLPKTDPFLQNDARFYSELLKILQQEDGIRVIQLMDEFQVSKSTIINDLSKVEAYFANRQIPLTRTRKGILLTASERRRRKEIRAVVYRKFSVEHLTEYIFSSDYTQRSYTGRDAEQIVWEVFEGIRLLDVKECIYYIQEALNVQFSDTAFIEIFLVLLIALRRIMDGYSLTLEPEETINGCEFKKENQIVEEELKVLCQKYQAYFNEAEVVYLTSKIATAQKVKNNSSANDRLTSQFLEILNDLCREKYHEDLLENPEVVQNLMMHLQMALTRTKYGISIYNPLLKEIQTQYPVSFLISREAADHFEKQYQMTISDAEAAYIATYVELALGSLAETEGRKLYRAVVVCSMGFATSRILSVNIEKTFQNIKVIDQLSVAMIPKYNFKSIDLVLSTVDISIMLTKPVIVINPMLNREDIKKIHQYINDESNQEIKLMQYTRIMDLLKQEAGIEDLEHMAGNLRNIMGISEKEEARKGLFDLMLPEFCHMTDRVANWEEGVWKAAEPLLEAGCIQKTYIEEIIRVKNEYRNYYLVGENLSMPHAAPEAGVNRMAISMIALREPLQVTLKSEKTIKIWVILILAAVDNHQHAKALQEISDIFEQEETVKKLSNSRSSEDLYKVLKKISGNFLDT